MENSLSHLAYLRDRSVLSRDLLSATGSIFVQISDENAHHVREVLDEVFGVKSFIVSIFLRKKGNQRGNEIKPINDYILWYCKDKSSVKRRFLYDSKLDASERLRFVRSSAERRELVLRFSSRCESERDAKCIGVRRDNRKRAVAARKKPGRRIETNNGGVLVGTEET